MTKLTDEEPGYCKSVTVQYLIFYLKKKESYIALTLDLLSLN